MKSLLIGAALALAYVAPAAAANFGCWNTNAIVTNNSPSGTWRNTASSSVDYLQATGTGISTMLANLAPFNNGTFAICLTGNSTTINYKKVWQVETAVICRLSEVSYSACQA